MNNISFEVVPLFRDVFIEDVPNTIEIVMGIQKVLEPMYVDIKHHWIVLEDLSR